MALLVGLVLVVASCGDTVVPQNSLDPASPQARKIDDLFWLVFWFATVIFVLVEGALIVAIFKFRRRGGVDRAVEQVHGNTRLEVMWTIAPVVLMAIIAVPTIATIFELRDTPDPADPNVIEVNVIGHQWWWEFEYPAYGFTTAQEMYIPVGKDVVLNIMSADVIHSFWVPRLNGKRDAVPGRVSHLTFHADEAGEYRGQCAEFCGLAHADMRHMVKAVSPADFEAWAQKHAEPPDIPTTGPAADGWETFQLVCSACHAIDGTSASARIAPNLSYFGERQRFGGWVFENDSEHLRAWLRDPSALKPMDPDRNDLAAGRVLGMPDFGLSEGEIDGLVALLKGLR